MLDVEIMSKNFSLHRHFKTLRVGLVWRLNPQPPAQKSGALPTELELLTSCTTVWCSTTWARTLDLLHNSLVLYHLSSDPWPPAQQSGALPTELEPLTSCTTVWCSTTWANHMATLLIQPDFYGLLVIRLMGFHCKLKILILICFSQTSWCLIKVFSWKALGMPKTSTATQ